MEPGAKITRVGTEKPLAGRTIVVTRAGAQAYGLAEQIERAGGQVIELPTIEIQPPESFSPEMRNFNSPLSIASAASDNVTHVPLSHTITVPAP